MEKKQKNNKEFFRKRRQRVNQKLQLLFNRVDFQQDIQEFRGKWHLPLDGIKDEDANQDWQRWLDEETDKYVKEEWPKTKEKMKQLINEGKLLERDDEHKRFNANVPLNAFHYDIWKILHKYKLPAHWHNSIKRYLLFNDPNNLWIPLGNVTMEITWDHKTNHRKLSLIIYTDTTLDDIRSIWPQVMLQQEQLQDKSADKFQPIPNLEIDKKAYELRLAGYKPKQIADLIADEYELVQYTYKSVNDSIKRHKKRIGII